MIAEKMRVIPTICCNEGCSERRITPQTIVRTGCNRTAKEVCAAGRRGRVIHIIIFLIILVTVFNILAILFGNEIIRYFQLENRFPSLLSYFKLRSKFQYYYLVWNVSVLFLLCIVGIFLNLLVLV